MKARCDSIAATFAAAATGLTRHSQTAADKQRRFIRSPECVREAMRRRRATRPKCFDVLELCLYAGQFFQ
jgi:hypothetical protein